MDKHHWMRSAALCEKSRLSHKAQHETAGGWSKKLRLVLRKFGVPENQFHRVKSGATSHESRAPAAGLAR